MAEAIGATFVIDVARYLPGLFGGMHRAQAGSIKYHARGHMSRDTSDIRGPALPTALLPIQTS